MSTYKGQPNPFLEVRVKEIDPTPGLIGLCAGYEQGSWRCKQLVDHLLEWLPEFSLTYEELQDVGHEQALRLFDRAVKTIYSSPKYERRGEIGELLLHVAIRQVFQTVPAISKFYYKGSSNETVKGFDAVHVVASEESLELWLGEAKIYKDVDQAIQSVVKDIQKHTKLPYLRKEFAAITNKIDKNWPHAKRLLKLLDKNTSIDEVFDKMCIPAFVAYQSPTIGSHKSVSTQYIRDFILEVKAHHQTFTKCDFPKILIHLFLLPVENKEELVKEFHNRLQAWKQVVSV